MTLGDFLKGQLVTRDPWNCSTMPADWCVALGYPDFAAAWRDVVEPAECAAVPEHAGGLLNLWHVGIGASLPIVAQPLAAGDIAVIDLGEHKGAIFTGERWAVRGARCVHFIAASDIEVVQAWRP